jgi:opacity protein-like surface antigen
MKKWLAMVMPLIPMACSHAAETGFYFNLGAGGVFSSSKTSVTERSTSVLYSPTAIGTSLFTLPDVTWNNRFKNGFDLSAAAGYHFNSHWRADAEFLYQNIQRSSYGTYGWLEQNSITGAVYALQRNNPISAVTSRANVYSLLTNAAFDFNSYSNWTPFVSGGIGVSWLKSRSLQTNDIINIDDPNTPLIETAPASQFSPSLYGTAFTWQFKAGVARELQKNLSVLLQYRVLGTSDFKQSNSLIQSNPGNPGESNFHIGQHDISGLLTQAVEVNLRWDV